MSKIGFAASFLAAFILMDGYFFDGETTRAVRDGVFAADKGVRGQFYYWTHRG